MMVNFDVTGHHIPSVKNRNLCQKWMLRLFRITLLSIGRACLPVTQIWKLWEKYLNLLKKRLMSWKKSEILAARIVVFLCWLLLHVDLLDIIPESGVPRSEIMAMTANTNHPILLHHPSHSFYTFSWVSENHTCPLALHKSLIFTEL